jgi:hypothetical protein
MRTSFHHQPEAQHPNFQLPTSWQADYSIFGSWSCKNAGGVSLTDRDQVVALFRAVLRLGLEATLVRRRTILSGGP